MRQIAEAQGIAWSASEVAHGLIAELKRDLSHGAPIEEGPLTYDAERFRMVRTKKVKAG